jgi:hypothetical protein
MHDPASEFDCLRLRLDREPQGRALAGTRMPQYDNVNQVDCLRQSLHLHGKATRPRDGAVSVPKPLLPRAAGAVRIARSDWV